MINDCTENPKPDKNTNNNGNKEWLLIIVKEFVHEEHDMFEFVSLLTRVGQCFNKIETSVL
jgi:hypothetical protein